ncbi:MAG: HEAT repeat domain-containing protein [Kofleriaceae bacterium]
MRLWPVALALFASVAAGDPVIYLSVQVQNVLTAIDVVPTQSQLDTAFLPADAATELVRIVKDDTSDVRVRLRAIHALTKYCTTTPCTDDDPAHTALVSTIAMYQGSASGSDLVLLRAAVEALGPQRVGTDLGTLEPLLKHTNRDIRTAAVHALRDLCNTGAITALREQQSTEPTDQVRLAISEALRILSQPQPCQ